MSSPSSKSTDGERIKLTHEVPPRSKDAEFITVWKRATGEQKFVGEAEANAQLPAILAAHDAVALDEKIDFGLSAFESGYCQGEADGAARDAEWMKALGREGIVVSINPATGKPEPFDAIKFQTGAAAVREQTARITPEDAQLLLDWFKGDFRDRIGMDDLYARLVKLATKQPLAAPLKEKAPPSLEEIAAIIRSTWEVGTETIEAAAEIMALWEVPTGEGK